MEEKKVYIKTIFFFLVGLLGVFYLSQPAAKSVYEFSPKVLPPKYIEKFSFGYNEAMADSFWLRALQNFDFCEKPCRKGWVYHMLEVVTDLSPRFRMAYAMGGSTLSIVLGDIEGAALIYEKGLKNFPKDWSLAYRFAYHELYERKNLKKAADLLKQAGQNGAPLWVQNLAARLYQQSGQIDLGRSVLLDLLSRPNVDPELRKKAQKKLNELNKLGLEAHSSQKK